jgi:hypothetical protein
MMLILVPTIFTNIAANTEHRLCGLCVNEDVGVFTWRGGLGPRGLWMVVVVPEFPFERLLGLSILVYSLASLRVLIL